MFLRAGILVTLLILHHYPFAQLTASFSHSLPITACSPNPLTVTFTNTSSGGAVAQLWKFITPGGQVFTTSTLPNPTMSFSAVGKYTVRLIVTGSGGQKDSTTQNNLVEIYAQPTVSITSAMVEGCLPLSVPLAATGTAGAGATIAGYQWAFAPANFPNLTGASASLHVTTPGTYTVNAVITDSHGCQNTASAPSHIIAYPALNLSVASTPQHPVGCSPTPLVVTYQSSLAAPPPLTYTYAWAFGAASPATSTLAQPGAVTYTQPGNYAVGLSLTTNLPTCSASISLPQHVAMGGASAVFSLGQTNICAGTTLALSPAQVLPGALYRWDTDGDGADDQFDPLVFPTYSTPGQFTIRLTASYNGCTATTSQQLTVMPGPVAGFDLANLTPCQPSSTIQTQNLSTGATGYQWNMPGCTPGSSTANDLSFITNGFGTYAISLIATAANGCKDTAETILKIGGPSPIVSLISDSLDGCVPRTFTFKPFMAPTRNVISWDWGFVGPAGGITPASSTLRTPTVTISLPGVYDVELTMVTADGCTHSYVLSSVISGDLFPDSLPVSITPQTVCNRQPVTFAADTTGHGAYTLTWDFDYLPPTLRPCSIEAVAQDSTFTHTGYHTTVLEVANGVCKHRQKYPMAYLVNAPIANFGVVNPAPINASVLIRDSLDVRAVMEVCFAGSPFDLHAYDLTEGPGTAWQWTFNQAPQPLTPTPDPLLETLSGPPPLRLQEVKLWVENTTTGCRDSVSKLLYISAPTVVPNVTQTGCWPNSVVYLDHQSYGGIQTFYWSWDQNALFSNHVKDTIFLADDVVHALTLTVIDSFGCKDVFTRDIQSAALAAGFVAVPTTQVCGPVAITFQDYSTSTSASGITQWQWDFGEPSSGTDNQSGDPNPTHIYTSTDSFDIQLIVSDVAGCSDTLLKQNMLFVSMPEINITVDTTTCSGNPLVFTNNAQQQGVSYAWDLGNGAVSNQKNATATYTPATQPASYQVQMTATDSLGCTNEYTQTIHIEYFEPGFTATPTAADCPPLNVQFTLQTVGNIGGAQWNFGNGTTGSIMNPLYTYQEPGTYTVDLTVFHEDGCPKSMSMPNLIQVLGPYGTMSADKPAVCPGDTVGVMVVTNDADSASVVFGDGEIMTAGGLNFSRDTLYFSHIYTSPGPKTVVAIGVSSLCSRAMTTYPLMVNTPPTAALAPVDTVLCLNTPRQVYSTAITGTAPVTDWHWAYHTTVGSDSSIAVIGTEIGLFSLIHIVTDAAGCADTLVQGFEVIPYPTVSLAVSDSTVCMGDTIAVKATVSPANAVLSWQYNALPMSWAGDSVAFSADSAGVLALTASDHACATGAHIPCRVFPNPRPTFTTVIAGCDSPLVTFAPADSLALAYRWFFGDSTFSNERFPVKQFVPGTYAIHYTAWGQNGCSSDTVVQLRLKEPPQAAFELFPCPDLRPYAHISFCIAPQITVPIQPGMQVRWDFGDGTLAMGDSVQHEYTREDTLDVKLTITDPETGCKAMAIHPHIVLFPDLMIPTFFSPNGDGKNDVWKVFYTGLPIVSSRIYDRWGRLMADLPTVNAVWDGTSSGEAAAAGVYFWVVQIADKEYRGNLTLTR